MTLIRFPALLVLSAFLCLRVVSGQDISRLSAETQLGRFLTPEFPLEPPVINSFAPRDQKWPGVASNGRDFLVAWTHDDSRALESDIIGTLVKSNGQVLDPNGVRICKTTGTQWFPAIASNGEDYLVVWMDQRNGTTNNFDIYAARVRSTGEVLDPGGIAIFVGPGLQRIPMVACSGSEYLVAWTDSGKAQVLGARVSLTGELLDSPPIAISMLAGRGESVGPAVASNGENYFVAWQDFSTSTQTKTENDIFGTRISRSGAVLDSGGIAIAQEPDVSERSVTVCGDNQNYFVAFRRLQSGKTPEIHGLRLSGLGQKLDAAPKPIIAADGLDEPQAVRLPQGILLGWEQQDDLWAMKLNSDLSIQEPAQFLASGITVQPRLAASSDSILATWGTGSSRDVLGLEILGATLPANTALKPLVAVAYSLAPAQQNGPAAAWNGSTFLALWHELKPGDRTNHHVRSVRLSRAGALLQPSPMAIPASTNNQHSARAAAAGETFLVLWNEDVPRILFNQSVTQPAIYAALLQPGQLLSGAERIPIVLPSGYPGFDFSERIATTPEVFLIAWFGAEEPSAVHARIIPRTGPPFPESIVLSSSPDSDINGVLAAASNGESFLVVWTEGLSNNRSLQSAHLKADGSLLSGPNWLASISTSVASPTLVWSGTEYLLAWHERRVRTTDVLGMRLNRDGQAVDGAVLEMAVTADDEFLPALAWDGQHYLLKWEWRGDELLYSPRLRRFSLAGEPLGEQPFEIITEKTYPLSQIFQSPMTTLAAGPDGVLMLYPGVGDDFAARIYGRLLLNRSPISLSKPVYRMGEFTFELSAESGGTFLIEASQNLNSWSEIQRIENFTGTAHYTNSSTTQARQFYRAKKF